MWVLRGSAGFHCAWQPAQLPSCSVQLCSGARTNAAATTAAPCSPFCSGVPDKIDGMPLTDVRLVNIKLISVTELKLITDRGAEGRRKLAELFSGPDRLVSSLKRSSAV